MSEKWPKKAPKSPKNCAMCTSTPKPRTGRTLGYVAQKRIPRAPSPPAAPHYYGFQASESPNETPGPPYQRSLGAAGGPASPHTVGANGGSTRVPGAIFSKVVPRPLGMLKQMFLGRFEPVVTRFGPWKIPKCLENGPFGDQQCGLFLVSGCWCTLRRFWGFLAPFWAVSRTYRGVRGQQRALGRSEVKPHVQCSARVPSFGRFDGNSGRFWAKKGCFGAQNAHFWEGTSRFGTPAPGRHRRVFGSKLGFGKATTWAPRWLE